MTDAGDPVGAIAAQRARSEAARVYEALKVTGKRSSHRVLVYRCQRRCLLLDVLRLPSGLIAHNPRYKLSPTVNAATSSEAGRAANTEDGDAKWRTRTYPVDAALNFTLTCDHVLHVVLEAEAVKADLDGRHAEMTVLANGQRCAK